MTRHWVPAMTMLLAAGLPAPAAAAACRPGVYGTDRANPMVVGVASAPAERRYLFRDGRRGAVGADGSPVECDADIVVIKADDGTETRLLRLETRETDTAFDSASTTLSGRLIEPAGAVDPHRPLVVLVHGSEKTAAVGSVYSYMLAAQGISVFVYDKRGTGASGGDYTQNFELLADDAAAALRHARGLAAGRFGRSGYFGGSQGGWVAPLAATRSPADFAAIGFGLVVSPIDEDREQLLDEARRLKLDPASIAQVEQLSGATATLLRSHFASGYEALEGIRGAIGDAAWASKINGEHSGEMLRMSDTDLRRVGRARFDNLELIWDYDAAAALKRLKVPLLWVLAAEDREAPIGRTRAILAELASGGRSVDAYIFPATDHGMFEYRVNPDGSRTATRIADGYLRLLADWIKGDVNGQYGRASKLR